MKNSPNT